MALTSCEGVSFQDSHEGRVQLNPARTITQSHLRAFPATDLQVRMPVALGIAELIYDPSNSAAFTARTQCPIGAMVLGALLWITTPVTSCRGLASRPFLKDASRFYTEVQSVNSRRELGLSLAMFEMTEAIYAAIMDFGRSGWPVFAAMAALAGHLSSGIVDPGSTSHCEVEGVDAWLQSSSWDVPHEVRVEAAKSVSDPGTEVCSATWPIAALLAQDIPLGLPAVNQWIHRCVLSNGMSGVLGPGWQAFWLVMDRVSSEREVRVSMDDPETSVGTFVEIQPTPTSFVMSLLPPHILGSSSAWGSLRFVADRIRAEKKAHCNTIFMGLVNLYTQARQVQGFGGKMQIVDVGAHMGDCCLWAVARWGDSLRCLAVERDKDAGATIQRSIDRAGLEGAMKSHCHTIVQEAPCASSDGRSAPSLQGEEVSLDCLLKDVPLIDILKVHTGGGAEVGILLGLSQKLHAARVGVAFIRTVDTPPERIEALVLEQGWPYKTRRALAGRDLILERKAA